MSEFIITLASSSDKAIDENNEDENQLMQNLFQNNPIKIPAASGWGGILKNDGAFIAQQ